LEGIIIAKIQKLKLGSAMGLYHLHIYSFFDTLLNIDPKLNMELSCNLVSEGKREKNDSSINSWLGKIGRFRLGAFDYSSTLGYISPYINYLLLSHRSILINRCGSSCILNLLYY
jgi:hypothetical protein